MSHINVGSRKHFLYKSHELYLKNILHESYQHLPRKRQQDINIYLCCQSQTIFRIVYSQISTGSDFFNNLFRKFTFIVIILSIIKSNTLAEISHEVLPTTHPSHSRLINFDEYSFLQKTVGYIYTYLKVSSL